MPGPQTPDEVRGSSASEPGDRTLIRWSLEGDQDAATQLYLRYARRLNSLVESQCSTELAHRVGVDDIVQSIFGSFFRLIRQGFYDAPDAEELWGLLLVIAIHKVREKAVYHRAAKRDMRRTFGCDEAGRHLELWSSAHDFPDGYLELVLDEPWSNCLASAGGWRGSASRVIRSRRSPGRRGARGARWSVSSRKPV